MTSREVAHALVIRSKRKDAKSHREVLLEQRRASETVMPGLWELPALAETTVPAEELRLTVRHSIMQVNYFVRIRTIVEDGIDTLTVPGGERRWVPLKDAAGMALTGLTRKVLARLHLMDAIAPQAGGDVL